MRGANRGVNCYGVYLDELDLVVDMTGFFKQYHSIRPYCLNEDPPHERERLQSPEARDELNGLNAALPQDQGEPVPRFSVQATRDLA